MIKEYCYDGSRKLDLSKAATGFKKKDGIKEELLAKTAANQAEIQQLQDRLYADGREGLIIILQARDAAGKDATVKHVLSGINPQGIDVHSFKQPTHQELAHDFLWRFNVNLPIRGKMAIFNRSYYEDVLVVKVHELYKNYAMPKRCIEDRKFFKNRYGHIVSYEDYLYANGYRIIKLFLNVSAQKQKERFLERIEEPEKNWKFSSADLAERALWNEYTKAYEDAINATAKPECPWYVVPADQKWYTRYVVSEIIVQTMREMNPQYPMMDPAQRAHLKEYRQALLEEDPAAFGVHADAAEKKAAAKEEK